MTTETVLTAADADVKPEIPVVLTNLWVDVFTKGVGKIGLRGSPAEGAVTGLDVQVILVACKDGFTPEVGQTPATVYLQGTGLDKARDLVWGGEIYHVQVMPLGKTEEKLSLIIGKPDHTKPEDERAGFKSFVYETVTDVSHLASEAFVAHSG